MFEKDLGFKIQQAQDWQELVKISLEQGINKSLELRRVLLERLGWELTKSIQFYFIERIAPLIKKYLLDENIYPSEVNQALAEELPGIFQMDDFDLYRSCDVVYRIACATLTKNRNLLRLLAGDIDSRVRMAVYLRNQNTGFSKEEFPLIYSWRLEFYPSEVQVFLENNYDACRYLGDDGYL